MDLNARIAARRQELAELEVKQQSDAAALAEARASRIVTEAQRQLDAMGASSAMPRAGGQATSVPALVDAGVKTAAYQRFGSGEKGVAIGFATVGLILVATTSWWFGMLVASLAPVAWFSFLGRHERDVRAARPASGQTFAECALETRGWLLLLGTVAGLCVFLLDWVSVSGASSSGRSIGIAGYDMTYPLPILMVGWLYPVSVALGRRRLRRVAAIALVILPALYAAAIPLIGAAGMNCPGDEYCIFPSVGVWAFLVCTAIVLGGVAVYRGGSVTGE